MKRIIYTCLCAAAIIACSPSLKIMHPWVSPDLTNKKFTKVMVLVLAPAKYNDAGRIGEEDMVKALRAAGVNAVSAQAEYGPQRFRNDSEQTALAKIRRSGADAVIITTLLDVDKDRQWVPDASWYPPPYYGHFWGYYSFWYDRAYNQGYYQTTRHYYFETNLYDLSSTNLIYSVQSETIDPGNVNALATSFSKRLVKDMRSRGVL